MIVKYNYLFLFLFLTNFVVGQNVELERLYDQFGVKKIKEYLYVINSDGSIGDSIGIHVAILDTLGRVKRKVSLDSTRQNVNDYEYEYVYDQNSNLIEIKVKPTNRSFTLMSKQIVYDHQGNKKLEKRYKGGELREKSEFSYNSKNQLRGENRTFYYPKETYEELYYLYDDAGNLYRKITKNKSEEVNEFRYDLYNNPIYESLIKDGNKEKYYLESEFDEHNRKIKDTFQLYISMQIPDIYAKIYSAKGDILRIEYEYNKMGLLLSKKQWLNDIFIGLKKYKYEI